MSQPSHQAASRISAMWKAHKAQQEAYSKFYAAFLEREIFGGTPFYRPPSDEADARSLPALTREQGSD